ncbi:MULTISPECIES: chromosome-anchoring protein RacA [Shouchella]|uniref:Chromosome-anchoring protein RacA n=2 Tax=Shouchella TaxID=2893057 RepID=A0ABY7W3I4_9BACI|nr:MULTISPECIES: chromosome-anchoring protein RacA [Shouchella]MED4127026.1 chromosome-anchoring protein RacA [Shouchella miscanthi]WDF03515.1 chromosome-anchoring protein RacA [Shouchella hunanensis]GAF23930.1 hypothetical protein JCM19047_3783 [Bacillus sp. JCM 19047]
MASYKTKEVSMELGVNPTTIQRWTKFFKISCDVNEQGHFLYTDEHLPLFRAIQEQLRAGKKLKDISLDSKQEKEKRIPSVPKKQYDAKLEQMYQQVHVLEQRLETKADDVVSYQLLKHRSELDDMMKVLDRLENRLIQMEERYQQENDDTGRSYKEPRRYPHRTWKAILSFFSF